MPSTLYRKYRPERFADIVGQAHIVETLRNAILRDRLAQVYLFTGPRGTGKTSFARILARAVNCEKRGRKDAEPCGACPACRSILENQSLDVMEIDAASHTGVDHVRELRETVKLPPMRQQRKVYIIDEVHMLSQGAWNALLKTLEEPPAHALFILCTTEIHKVPETILSRAQRFDFQRLGLKHIAAKLSAIAKAERVKVDEEALQMVALAARGGMRDAESLLGQVIALEDKHVTAAEAGRILGVSEHALVERLVRALGERDTAGALRIIRDLADAGHDGTVFCDALLDYLRLVLLASFDPALPDSAELPLTDAQAKTLKSLVPLFRPADLVRILETFQLARRDIRLSPIPELPLEVAVVKSLPAEATPTGEADQSGPPPPPPAMSGGSDRAKRFAPAEKKAPPLQTSSAEESAATLSFDEIRMEWRRYLEAVRQENAGLSLALSGAVPLACENGRLKVAVKFPLHRDTLNRPESRLTLEKVLGTMLKSQIGVMAVLAEDEAKNGSASINDALSILGGRVVPEQTGE